MSNEDKSLARVAPVASEQTRETLYPGDRLYHGDCCVFCGSTGGPFAPGDLTDELGNKLKCCARSVHGNESWWGWAGREYHRRKELATSSHVVLGMDTASGPDRSVAVTYQDGKVVNVEDIARPDPYATHRAKLSAKLGIPEGGLLDGAAAAATAQIQLKRLQLMTRAERMRAQALLDFDRPVVKGSGHPSTRREQFSSSSWEE